MDKLARWDVLLLRLCGFFLPENEDDGGKESICFRNSPSLWLNFFCTCLGFDYCSVPTLLPTSFSLWIHHSQKV